MTTAPTKADTDSLEMMIDRIGLTETLNCIAAICAEKADHVRSNWQDESLASEWDKSGSLVSLTADSINSIACG